MSAPVVYQIRNWRETFENNKSRERERCGYVCVPNKQGGMGLSNILALPDGPAIYGIWQLMVGAASRQGRHRDGWLTDDGHRAGTAWAPSDMAVLWRCPEALIERAIEVLTGPRVGWLACFECAEVAQFTQAQTQDGHHAGTNCPPSAPSRASEEENGIEEKKTLSPAGAIDSPESNPQVTPPTLEEVKNIASMRGVALDCAEAFWNANMATGWVDGRGIAIRNWTYALTKYAATWRAHEQRGNSQNGQHQQTRGRVIDRNAGNANAGLADEYKIA